MDVIVNVDAARALRIIRVAPREIVTAFGEFFLEGGALAAGEMKTVLGSMLRRSASGTTVNSIEAIVERDHVSVGPTTRTKDGAYHIGSLLASGTKPHVIRPVKAKALAWAGMGKNFVGPVSFVREGVRGGRRTTRIGLGRTASGADRTRTGPLQFAKEVHHPGTDEVPYIEETARRIGAPLEELMERKLLEAMKRAGVD